MDKNKKKNIKLISLLIFAVLFCSVIFCGCDHLNTILFVIESGKSVGKVIYTDNVDKYLQNRVVVDEIQNGSVSFSSGAESGVWVLETDNPNKYDLVFTTVPVEYYDESSNQMKEGKYATAGFTAERCDLLKELSGGEYITLDNSYIFSGIAGAYTVGGEYVCSNPDCTGPIDAIDGCLCNKYCSSYWTVDSKKTEDEVREYFSGYCPGCTAVSETDNGDGTYTYTLTAVCNCSGVFLHDGTWKRELCSVTVMEQQDDPTIQLKFDELVLDGYDFGYLYDYITTTDFGETYHDYEQYYNPGDFSHMFSDLNVEKIKIINVKGLGDKVVDFSSMFENCTNLKSIEFGNLFENCKPQNISRMFYNCPKLENIDLTSLDTSNVTNMSEMFVINPQPASYEERDEIAQEYINNVLILKMPEYNDGTVYTVETFAQKMEITKEQVYYGLIVEEKLNIPISYSELVKCLTGLDFIEFYNAVKEDPTQFGLPDGTYNLVSIIQYIKDTALLYNINAVYDAEFYANTDRESYVNYVINDLIVPVNNIPVAEQPYTLESLASCLETTKEKTLLSIIDETGFEIPFTYDEYCLALFDMSFDEVVTAVNQNPADFDLEPKQDGSSYTKDELISFTLPLLTEKGLKVFEEAEEIEQYYKDNDEPPRGNLILGGTDSKFVVKNNTDVTDMFGEYCLFETILTPNQIDDNIELILTKTFAYNDTKIVTKITSNDNGKMYKYKKLTQSEIEDLLNQDNPPENNDATGENDNQDKPVEPKKNYILPIVLISITSIAIIGIFIFVIIKIFKRKKYY